LALKVLVTGGAGYIGSHTIVELLLEGHEVVCLDNFCNSSPKAIDRIIKICESEGLVDAPLELIKGDILNENLLKEIFSIHSINNVIHFAGLKAVGESGEKPIEYYKNNVEGSIKLFRAMSEAEVFKIAFSSSATVYGEPKKLPICEKQPTQEPTNPYGKTKLIIENILHDIANSDDRWHIAILRYFNPIGAHSSGLIGDYPNSIPNNLVPFISQVAVGNLTKLQIFGNDYPTKDGTGVRDYIHVVDLAKGHLKSLQTLEQKNGAHIWNLGTGQGYSVLEIIGAFEKASQKSIPYEFVERRQGDIASCWADPYKAKIELDWKAELYLNQMMEDSWRWQNQNPNGYND